MYGTIWKENDFNKVTVTTDNSLPGNYWRLRFSFDQPGSGITFYKMINTIATTITIAVIGIG